MKISKKKELRHIRKMLNMLLISFSETKRMYEYYMMEQHMDFNSVDKIINENISSIIEGENNADFKIH